MWVGTDVLIHSGTRFCPCMYRYLEPYLQYVVRYFPEMARWDPPMIDASTRQGSVPPARRVFSSLSLVATRKTVQQLGCGTSYAACRWGPRVPECEGSPVNSQAGTLCTSTFSFRIRISISLGRSRSLSMIVRKPAQTLIRILPRKGFTSMLRTALRDWVIRKRRTLAPPR